MRASSLALDATATAESGSPRSPLPVTVEFGGRVVNADAGGPVERVRVSLHSFALPSELSPGRFANVTATSGGDGTFTLPLNLTMGWTNVYLQLTAPPGYDDTYKGFEPATAADRPAIKRYRRW